MKSIKQVIRSIGATHAKKCVSTPNKWNSCEPCKNCSKPANYGSSSTPPSPCCGAFPIVPFWNDAIAPTFVQSDPLQMAGINCRTTLTFTAQIIQGDPTNGILNLFVGNVPIEIYNNVPQTVTVIDTDYVYFDLLNITINEDICFSISLYNETCNIDYGRVLYNLCATIS